MYTGVRLTTLSLGEPLLNQHYTYNEKYGKEAVISRLEDQFIKAYNLGINYIIDTIIIEKNGTQLSLHQGFNGEYWTLDERLALYQEYSKKYNINIVLEIDFQDITTTNINEYIYTILYDIILKYSWVQYWIIGIQPDEIINDTYKCAPELYVYLLQQIYPKIKSFNSNILVGGPNIHQSVLDYINDRTGWLNIASGNQYSENSIYYNIGKNGIFDYIDIFAILGKQNSQYASYTIYAVIINNIRELIYNKLGENNILIFATDQGHNATINDTQIKNDVIESVNNNSAVSDYSDEQLDAYTHNLISERTTLELNKQAYYDIKEILNALKCGVISFKRELINSKGSSYGIFVSPNISATPKSTTYTFIYDILKQYSTVVKDSSIYESNNKIESITLQVETDGIIKRATIIWPAIELDATVILQASSYFRQYQINNINKDVVSYNATSELSISISNLLVVYEQVNQFVFDESDIALNISRRLKYQREILDQMMSELPSSYNRDTTDTNIYKIMRAFASEFAEASMRLTMVKEDNLIDNAREDALYHNFGSLIRLQKQSNWSYEKYRKMIKGILSSLFKGPTTASVATALQLFTNFKVSIGELYKESVQKRYADLLNYYNPTFTFVIELEKPLEDTTYTQQELIEDNAYILQLTKPAHTIGILIIVLVAKENWYTYYKEKYDKDWIYNDETNISIDSSKIINESQYGWKAIGDFGTFINSPHEDNGIYSSNSLINGGMVIGPRYTLFDTAYFHKESTLRDVYFNNKLKEELLLAIGTDAVDTYTDYKDNLYEISSALAEPKFGFINNNYMQLSGTNLYDKVLNKYIVPGSMTKLKDELITQQQQFFSDKFMFSSMLQAIQFTTQNGISKQFAVLNNIITEWQTYLQEHSFKEKLDNGVIVERVTDKINLYLEGYKEKFKRIYERNSLSTNLNDVVNVTDSEIQPFKFNNIYNNHKLNPSKKEKVNYAARNTELYNILSEYLPYYVNLQVDKDYYHDILDYYYSNYLQSQFNDKYYLFDEELTYKFNKQNGTLIPYRSSMIKLNLYTYEYQYSSIKELNSNIYNDLVIDNYNRITTDRLPSIHSELTDRYILNQQFLQFNKDNGKLLNRQIETFNLLYWYNERYNKLILDNNYINLYHKNIDIYSTKDDTINAINSEITDKYRLKYSQQNFQFNKYNNILLSQQIESFGLNFWYKDQYNSNIHELLLVHLNILPFETYTPKNDNSYFNNESTEKYQLKYDQQRFQFNKYNNKLLSNFIEIFNLNYWYHEDYSPVNEFFIYNIDFRPVEKYIAKEDSILPISTDLTDKYYLLYDQNKLQFNKYNGKLIAKRIEIFNLLYQYNDKYNFTPIDKVTSYNVDNTSIEQFTDINELYTVYNDFNDQFSLYDEDDNYNNYFRFKNKNDKIHANSLNNNNLKRIYGSSKFNNILLSFSYNDNYESNIIDELTYNIDYTEKEKFKVINELYNVYNDFTEQYKLYNDKNALQFNKKNGKLLSNNPEKFTLLYWYKDNYEFNITDELTYNLDYTEKEKFKVINELYNVYNDFVDQYRLYDEDDLNNYFKFKNKNDNVHTNSLNNNLKRIYGIHKFNNILLSFFYKDNYEFNIIDELTYNIDYTEKEKFKVASELYNVYNDFTDRYKLYDDENVLQFNKKNGKLLSNAITRYTFDYWYKDNYEFNITDELTYNIDYTEKEKFKTINELYNVYTNFSDRYDLYDDESVLCFNKQNGKLISKTITRCTFDYRYKDNYNLEILDNCLLHFNDIENEKYNLKQELIIIDANCIDYFKLYDEDNNNLFQFNRHVGKLFSKRSGKLNFDYWYRDKYILPNEVSYINLDTARYKEKYTFNSEQYTYNPIYTDKFDLYDEDNLFQFNKRNGILLSRKFSSYIFNCLYADKYEFNDDPYTANIYLSYYENKPDIQERLTMQPIYTEKYVINDRHFQFNKRDGKTLISSIINRMQLYVLYNEYYPFRNIQEYNQIFLLYKEFFKECIEYLNVTKIHGIYNEIYHNILSNINFALYNKEIFHDVKDSILTNLFIPYEKEKFKRVKDINYVSLINYEREKTKDIIEKNNITNFTKDKYNQVYENNNIYTQHKYKEEIDSYEDQLAQIEELTNDSYFDLNTDNRLLQCNLMQLNNCKFLGNEIYNTRIEGYKEKVNSISDHVDNTTDQTEQFNQVNEEIDNVQIDMNNEILYSKAIEPFQFFISKFNDKKFFYKTIRDVDTIETINSEHIKPILMFNQVNLQCREQVKKAKELYTVKPKVYYNETYNKYMDLNSYKYIEKKEDEQYKMLSTVAYMQTERLINNKYIIIRKNSYT